MKVVLMLVVVFLLGSLWGRIIDLTIAFSTQSIAVEVSGAIVIGFCGAYYTRKFWLRSKK